MLRRIFWILGIILGLALGAALLGPFLISTQSLVGREPASAVATPQSRFVQIPFPGTEGIELHYLSRPVRLYTFFLNNPGHRSCQSCRA